VNKQTRLFVEEEWRDVFYRVEEDRPKDADINYEMKGRSKDKSEDELDGGDKQDEVYSNIPLLAISTP